MFTPDGRPVAIVGGTGRLGAALAFRLARAGVSIRLGSRDEQRGRSVAAEMSLRSDRPVAISGHSNEDAVADCELAVITLPFASLEELLPPLAPALDGHVVISTVVPLIFEARQPKLVAVPEGSAAEQIRALLPGSRVTAALQTISSVLLGDEQHTLEGDALITGDDPDATADTDQLIRLVGGLRPVICGGLQHSIAVEALAVLMLSINRRHRGAHAGVAITGLN